MKKRLLSVRNLSVRYLKDQGDTKAVDSVSFDLRPGEILGLAGESGSGKSTIAQALLRTLPPPAVITGGQVLFEGKDVLQMNAREVRNFRWQCTSIVFQSAMNALNPVMSVEAQIVDVLRAHGARAGREAKRAQELIELVGIEPRYLSCFPHQLSGGMRQRVVIAIALALDPKLLIMDEPTTALDVIVQKELLAEVLGLRQRLGFAILFISHDLPLMFQLADRVAILYAGSFAEVGKNETLRDMPAHPYTRGLLSSAPTLKGSPTRLAGIEGLPPDLVTTTSACAFRPRCPRALPECSHSVPPLVQMSQHKEHFAACYSPISQDHE